MNYNGPKVKSVSLSKIRLYAGKSEYPTLLLKLLEFLGILVKLLQIFAKIGRIRTDV